MGGATSKLLAAGRQAIAGRPHHGIAGPARGGGGVVVFVVVVDLFSGEAGRRLRARLSTK